MGDGLRELDALAHAFAVGGDGAVGGFRHGDALEGFAGELGGFGLDHAMHQQERIDELVAGETFGKGIELGAVSHFAEQFFGAAGWDAEHVDRAAGGADEAGHQVHQRGFAGAVGTDQAGDAGADGEVHAIDAEDFAVEARDVVEDDAGGGLASLAVAGGWWLVAGGLARGHRTTSAPRILRESR